jgi:large repetitive protein
MKTSLVRLLASAFCLIAFSLWTGSAFGQTPGTFSDTGSLGLAIYGNTATLLDSGLVLIAGGVDGSGYVSGAELYNPETGTFTPTGSLHTARAYHTATLLKNGMVLIAAGQYLPCRSCTWTNSAELYNPSTGTFTVTGSLNSGRASHTATLLINGQVLIAGGTSRFASLSSAELCNPATGAFSTTGSMTTARDGHTATLLNNGTVLAAGGGPNSAPSAELYNPSTGTFAATGSMVTNRDAHTATLLGNGTVLIAGGYGGGSCDPWSLTGSAQAVRR